MLGAADLYRVMQQAGASQVPQGIQLGTMTAHNECMIGDEIQLKPFQLYFFENSVMRYARTAKVQVRGIDNEFVQHETEEESDDLSVYMEPLKEGDIIALMPVPDGRYLVLGKVISGEDVLTLEEQIEEDKNIIINKDIEINNKFNYPRNLPFLYIREDNTENDLFPNPLSTMEIKNLLKSKVIKPFLVKIKPIDIFTMKNYPQFSYFDFNEILTKNWSKNLEYSSMFLEEYKNLNERNSLYNLEDKNKTLKISKEYFSYQKLLKKKNIEIENNKIGKMIGKKNNDITLDLNFSISQIDKTGFNDLSMSIIKQLQNVKLTQKQVNKITSIIDEVEEDEWTEIKNKKKENESIPFVGIVGLNESKQITEKNISQNNKKNKKRKDKNKKFVNMKNNQFAGLKINYSSDEENNI